MTHEIIAPRNVDLGDKNVVKVFGMGSIVVKIILKGNINQIHIKDGLQVPKLHVNFLLVSKLVSNSLKVQFNLNKCIVNG